ncbi:MAG TPA: glycosyltransferase [Candidatus Paceibacterota bacterium]|nr:glycosyltransferase [Candidatus Paceibacterota bacterium]
MLYIPKIFHHIWLGNAPLPEKFSLWLSQWEEMNPGWTVMRWTDQNLPEITNRKEFDEADRMAKKSDILRYEVCLQYGGVYIDADFEPLKPIEPILDGVHAFIADEHPGIPCNALIGCEAGQPFFKVLVDRLPESIRHGMETGGDIVEQTGPKFLKRCLDEYEGNDQVPVPSDAPGVLGRRVEIRSSDGTKSVHLFEYSVFYPYYYTEPEKEDTVFPEAFGKHHWTASWWKNGGI